VVALRSARSRYVVAVPGRSLREIPILLRVYVAVSVPVSIYFAIASSARPAFAIVGPVFVIALAWFLLRGSRVAWLLIIAGSVISLATFPFGSTHWWSVPLALFDAVCLLVPSSRAFVWSSRPGEARPQGAAPSKRPTDATAPTASLGKQTTWDAKAQTDADRPSGWYVDPADPARMHYWDAGQGDWLGGTKTPNKIFRELDLK
jgi:hypothetical protein